VWVCGFFYALVLLGVGWMIVRARRQRLRDRASGTRADRAITAALTVWTVVIAVTLIGLTTASYVVERNLHASERADLTIRVTGKQWWWQVEYLDADPSKTFVTANELRLPLGKTAKLELHAADVIHSLWIPNLHGKRDLIPGRVNTLYVTPRKPGPLRGQCGEFCGLQHAHMSLDVQVDDDAAFERWRAQQLAAAASPESEGARWGATIFVQQACVMCHAIRGTDAGGRSGPDLTHLASRKSLAAGALRLDRGSLQAWIADPQSIKPGTNMPAVALESAELNALVDYLLSLR
jgi:cytochrome c oxidase subunit 2